MNDVAKAERDKYAKIWANPDYRTYSPGEWILPWFLMTIKPRAGSSFIDCGAGTGRAALTLHEMGYDVTPIDIVDTALDPEAAAALGNKLRIGALWDMNLPYSDYAICTDVMEHIPPELVMKTLRNIVGSVAIGAFFYICFNEDHFGSTVEEELHLTVKPFTWWRDRLNEVGTLVEARDLINNGFFWVLP